MPRHTLTILCLLLASTAPVLPEGVGALSRARATAEAMDEMVRYTVKSGDTLKGLAKAHFVNSADWKLAQTLNGVKDPDALLPGSVLLFRQSWLKAAPIRAEIAAYRGDVGTVSGALRVPASVGLLLDEGDLVETGANGFVTLRLPDASLVTLPSNSRIRLSRLRSVSLTESIDRRFHLEAGRSEAKVTPMTNPASKFMITTPVSVAAVRGTLFRVSYTPAEMKAREEVLEGKVEVGPKGEPSGKAGETLLLPGFGAVATRDGVSGAIALLAAPALDNPGKAQTSKAVSFRLKPLPGAAVYVIELATDAAFVDRFAELETSETDISFAGVPNGSLHVRIAARDANGLTGVPTTYAFERRFAGVLTSGNDDMNADNPPPRGRNPRAGKLVASPSSDGSDSAVAGIVALSALVQNSSENAATTEAAASSEVEQEEGDAAWDSEVAPSGDLFSGGFGSGGGGSGGGGAPGGENGGDGGGSGGSDGGPAPVIPPVIPPVIGPDLPPPFSPPPALPPFALPPFAPPAGEQPPVDLPPVVIPPAFPPDNPPPVAGGSGGNPGSPPTPPAGPANPVVAVPEPAAWAMLISGFGLVGWALRRRRGLAADSTRGARKA